MRKSGSLRLYAFVAAALLTALPAAAQYSPRTEVHDPATGEKYHIEGAAGFWRPDADMSISSEQLGIEGSTISFKDDLGLVNKKFSDLKVVGRPARKHKLRFEYIPIKYEQDSYRVTRPIIFNGQVYNVGVPVTSVLDWKAYRFTYEYDFQYHDRWFAGLLLEAKYTDVNAILRTPIIEEFAHAKAPIPAFGGIFRGYVTPNISVTGELSGITLPASVSDQYNAHYADLDIYGTVNFTNNIGGQVGYRSFDVAYKIREDEGNFVLKGFYFGVVARY
jgi:hypothetical protein